MTARYAIYFAPADESELARFGQNVLVRTALNPDAEHLKPHCAEWMALLTSPRHYGFHATLKAPFSLHQNTSEEHLLDAVALFAEQQAPMQMVGLEPRQLHQFLALAFVDQPLSIRQFAERCVLEFEEFRAPLSAADRARRQPDKLTARQREYLDVYGYPYVREEFNFHMTLSSQLEAEQPEFFQWLKDEFARVVITTPALDHIAVYVQPDRSTPFIRLSQYELSGKMEVPG